ncbi:MAG: hypothetical protein EBT13_12620 [Rhodobacteraceae bacterium]|nr:hypothetical protein [Paracoccaceae bacterium]
MGCFSKTCAKSHWPVVSQWRRAYPDFTQVVALLPNGEIIRGAYDGYGRVDGIDVMESPRGRYWWPRVKLVLERFYAGETYDQLGRSGDELAQGYFMSGHFLDHCFENGPFKNRAAYRRAFKLYANW